MSNSSTPFATFTERTRNGYYIARKLRIKYYHVGIAQATSDGVFFAIIIAIILHRNNTYLTALYFG